MNTCECDQCETLRSENQMLKDALQVATRAIKFYATYQPRQHPEGYYEIHIAKGEGGENRFGYFAKEALETISTLTGNRDGEN